MKFCKNCGKELNTDAKFCTECGMSVQEQKNTDTKQTRVPERKPMSPKQKKWIIAGVAAVVLLLGAYKIGQSLLSKERLINNFEEALIEEDEKKVAKLLHSSDKKLEINKDTIKPFMKYYKENPDEIQETVESLKEQAAEMDGQQDTKNVYDFFSSTPDGMVDLQQDGKFLFYEKYQLMIDPAYLILSTNYKDTELYINSKKVDKADQANFEKTYGPYVPGVHNVEAKLKSDFVDLVAEKTVTAQGEDEQMVNLYLEGENLYLNTSIDSEDIELNGKLYINGKDVGINPFKVEEFGPVLTDGSMKIAVEAELPWGTIKTKEKEINSKYIEVNLSEHEETQTKIMNTIVENTRESLIAIANRDNSKMTMATDELKESIQEEVDEAKEYEELFKGKYIGSTFNLDSFNISYEEEEWVATVEVLVKGQGEYYYKDETPELEDESEAYEVELVYDTKAKKWLVDSMDYMYFFDDENVKEITEESPKMYPAS